MPGTSVGWFALVGAFSPRATEAAKPLSKALTAVASASAA